jgi:hypothetical protein
MMIEKKRSGRVFRGHFRLFKAYLLVHSLADLMLEELILLSVLSVGLFVIAVVAVNLLVDFGAGFRVLVVHFFTYVFRIPDYAL